MMKKRTGVLSWKRSCKVNVNTSDPTVPSLQMHEPSVGEQDAWLWQEQVNMQLGPYRPGGHSDAQSSP